jgi:chorismate synthase
MNSDLVIRALKGTEELKIAQTIMGETWGYEQDNMAALPTVIATSHVGGLVAGAFEGGEMIAMSWAFPGVMDGETLLYSQMTAVLEGHRGKGIGKGIKWFQREWALENGFGRIRWTYDPLMAANARFNLRYLGATAITYLVDFYGPSDSTLHGALPTDRLIADWDLKSPRVAALAAGCEEAAYAGPTAELPEIYALTETTGGPAVPGPSAIPNASQVPYALAPVPPDFLDRQRNEPEVAEAWRLGTREAYSSAFEAGYTFVDFVPLLDRSARFCSEAYLLSSQRATEGSG